MPQNKLQRIRVKPLFDENGAPKTSIPVYLNDPYQGKKIELYPDAEVDSRYAEALLRTNSIYEKISQDFVVNKEEYKVKENYKEQEFDKFFPLLTPDMKDIIAGLMSEMIKKDNEKDPKFLVQWMKKVIPFFPPVEEKMDAPTGDSPENAGTDNQG